uniref:SWIM-type domain-containing protein n=1 Tax=Lactuca sativa TaxID=4236 RepID=A0A9R1VL94_LACSA|nr:hypothetical protein LSAT_V11C500271910 [Lactuca sativa]
MGHIEEVCKGNLFNHLEERICEDIGGEQSVRLNEFEAFTEDGSYCVDFDDEYSVPNGEDNQDGDGSHYNGDDFYDSDYIIHESNLQFDVNVEMSEFQSVVDIDEHGILDKQTKIFARFYEDERTRMLKEMGGAVFQNKEGSCGLHAIKTRRSIYLAKNDKIGIRVKCGGVVLVKTVHDIHKCLQTRSVKACTSKYLENIIVPQIQSNPRIPIKALHEELCKKLELGMSVQKVAKAKQMVERALELQNTNPSTTVRIDVYPEPCLSTTTRTFRRIYVCLGALKLGFKVGLRDFLGVDGTFLKGPYHGQVLTVVGLNANNGIYPIAYAVVEAEPTSSWTWFMELLGEDLQKGIIPTVAKVFPNAEHRFCFRHIQENMKKQWKGKELNDKKINDEAHSWLCKIPAETWSKSHFSGIQYIDDGMDKPIITCLKYIKEYLMKRLFVVQKKIDKCQGELSITTTIILEEIKTKAAKYVANYNGAGKYQVASTWHDQYVVNLNERSCTCRFWEITNFPCRHVVSAIWNKIENGEDAPDVKDWAHPCYKLSTWRAMYLNKIDPTNGRSM